MDNYGLPKLNISPFTAQYNLFAINASTLVLPIVSSITIPPGFASNNSTPMVRLSVDQHTLRFYVSEQLTATGAIQYVLRLVGTVFYNVAFMGVSPIDPVTAIQGPIAFTNNGSYNVDYTVGTFGSIAEIQNLILSNFTITATINQFYVIADNGTPVVFDPANPAPFIAALNGATEKTIYVTANIVITFNEGPIS
ncbi:MAG: hypothetical protein J6F30_12855 [Cellulosilyticum sp.]|nr:hypothetical protein [Cellulosilyticum sp.]